MTPENGLRALRRLRRFGLSQRAIADAVHVTQPAVAHVLSGRRSLPSAWLPHLTILEFIYLKPAKERGDP
jgi:predicted transcriptional regulator